MFIKKIETSNDVDVRNIDRDLERKINCNVSLKRLVLSAATGLLVGCALNKAFNLGCTSGIATTSRQYNDYIELEYTKKDTAKSEENKADN